MAPFRPIRFGFRHVRKFLNCPIRAKAIFSLVILFIVIFHDMKPVILLLVAQKE